MEMLQYINNNFSGILSAVVSGITAIITLIYVVFTYKQMKATQESAQIASKQIRISNQPCVVIDSINTYGSECFNESGRRQLHIELQLENIGDSPALEVYTLSYLELQHTKNVRNGSDMVSMDFYPDYLKYLKPNTQGIARVRYETDEINMLVEDLRYSYEKNMSRIRTNPSKHPYSGTIMVVEVYYKNLLGQWFRNTLRQEICWLTDKNALPRKTKNLNENTIPPCLLSKETEFELQLVAPRFSVSSIELISKEQIANKLKPYKDQLDTHSFIFVESKE